MSPTPSQPQSPIPDCHEIPAQPADADYTPLLLAFGPADHDFEAEGSDDADAYVVGYN